MNKLISTLFLVLLFHISFAEIPTIKEQLENLNRCWKSQSFEDKILDQKLVINNNEVRFIQFHLSFVEQKLRKTNIDHLNYEQKKKRVEVLDILHKYMLNGVFPKNLYHEKRTPYFIDHFGTACAVGYLIINSGYKEFAEKISLENNYSYIYELDLQYSQLRKWAVEHGFTIDELAWIQPAYTICDTLCDLYVSIGVSSGTTPFTFDWDPPVYLTQVMGNTQFIYDFCPDKQYTCTVTDANGNVVPAQNCTISYEVPYLGTNTIQLNSFPVYLFTAKTDDDGTCNGSVTVFAVGSPPHTYLWQKFIAGNWQNIGSTHIISNQCSGIYRVFATNAYNCTSYDSVVIDNLTGLEEITLNEINLFTNPVGEEIVLSNINGNILGIEIYNIQGKIVLSVRDISTNFNNVLNIQHLSNGLYSLKIIKDDKILVRNFIKN